MRSIPRFEHPDLIVGTDHFADAGVYRVAPNTAIVQSTDFFSPIVDDADAFGRIAAANALGDVYAAGARPVTVLNIVLFPDNELDLGVLERILGGAADVVRSTGAVVVGGHTVRSAEIVFGLSVTGLVDPADLRTNAGARPGDAIVLTKGLGTGVIATAHRRGTCPDEVLAAGIDSMAGLHDAASAAAVEGGASAMTDITGFGFAVHAAELAEASDVSLRIMADRLPVIPGAESLATAEHRSRASATNRERARGVVEVDPGISPVLEELVFDPQTSGGLLVTGPPAALEAVAEAAGAPTTVIGRVEPAEPGGPRVRITRD